MGLAVGIDLGTTNCSVAVLDEHDRPVIVRNGEGANTTPSVICFRDGEVLVGAEARDLQRLGEPSAVALFKRLMGDSSWSFCCGRDYTAIDLSALLLGKLKADAEETLGEPIGHAVITVPAYFRDRERKATVEAGRAAGLDVLQVINEPTAAAIAYGSARGFGAGTGSDAAEAARRVLVYDLGGGTFDVTLLESTASDGRVLCSDGDHQLGGSDWDDRIVEYVRDQFLGEHRTDPFEDRESLADLCAEAEAAKQRLSALVTTAVPVFCDGRQGRYALTREKLEALTEDLLERTIALSMSVVGEARTNGRELRPDDLDAVLLVGGSTRMPAVRRRIEEVFGQAPLKGVNEDEAVALGAAIVAAARQSDASGEPFAISGAAAVTDVTSHSLGMISENEDRSAYVNSIILPKNDPIPCEHTRPFQQRTRPGRDNVVEVYLTQGETERPGDVEYVGKYVIRDIPHNEEGITVVDITYRYDRSGIVEVAASARAAKATRAPFAFMRRRPEEGRPENLPVMIEGLPDDVPDRFLEPPPPEVEEGGHISAYIVVDLSGSMAGSPLEEAQTAALNFLKNVDIGHCSLGVMAFADRVKTTLRATQSAREISDAILDLERRFRDDDVGWGTTADPFPEIKSVLGQAEGRRFAIVLTDGRWSYPDPAVASARACHDAGIDVIAIGFGAANHAFLREIASSDEVSFFTSEQRLVETFSTIAQVLTETGGELTSDAARSGLAALREA